MAVLNKSLIAQLRRESLLMRFSNKVRRARELAGLTQVQLAEELKEHQASISRVERIRSSDNLPLATCRKYAKYFGVRIEELFPESRESR